MRFCQSAAVVLGVLTPVAETVRRWSTWRERPPALFDDYVLGAFLLLGAWASRRDWERGRAVLAAAWGFTCAIALVSVVGQVEHLQRGEVDPAPIPSVAVLGIKIAGSAIAIVALVQTLRAPTRSEPRRD